MKSPRNRVLTCKTKNFTCIGKSVEMKNPRDRVLTQYDILLRFRGNEESERQGINTPP